MLNGADARVVGAVVVASQEVLVLSAQAGIVCETAGVDLALDRGETGIEDAVDSWASTPNNTTTSAGGDRAADDKVSTHF